jgi:hypothetical protein
MFNKFIDKEILLELIEKKTTFNECKKILNVSKRTLLKFRKLYGLSQDREMKNFNSECPTCGQNIEYVSTKEKIVHCSRNCANKRNHNQSTKDKISNTLKSKIIKEKKYCINCESDITMKPKKTKFCCRSCASKFNSNSERGKYHIKKLVEKSVKTQSRRSKNEILFFEYCRIRFESVENNLPIFNGWDADIVIHDHKIAVMWNGIWHYKKIRKNHSVLQVQNRDKIKIQEILKFGYTPYVIKDMGKFSKNKVQSEFEKLLEYLKIQNDNTNLQ